jgi:hypothetical protein
MRITKSYLYLLPISFDKKHEESAKYYIENGVPINDLSDIPVGRRAFHLNIYQCPSCGDMDAGIEDFLQVHDKCVLEGGTIYPYEAFSDFIRDSQMVL